MPRPITDSVVAAQAAALNDGGWAFTPRQLYYATCAAVEVPVGATARGEFGCAAILLLVTLISIGAPKAVTGVLAIITVAAFISALRSRRLDRVRAQAAPGRSLAMSAQRFDELWVRPHRLHGGERFEGMLLDPEQPDSDDVTPALDGLDVIVCDRQETAALLRANAGRAGLGLAVVTEAELARGGRPSRVFTVHDADPHGCALAVRSGAFAAVVVDVGLRPDHLDRADAPIIEGAPAALAEGLGDVLDDRGTEWLAAGRRGELAMIPPRWLLPAIVAAVANEPAPYLASSNGSGSGPSAASAPRVYFRVPLEVRLPAVGPMPPGGQSSSVSSPASAAE